MGEVSTATLGGGCFWCIEAAFKQLNGVESVTSGYSGGDIENPSYEKVCSGTTDHAEVVQIDYNPEEVSYEELLEVFFTVHDPTQMNRQGPDVGPQYRSIVFWHDNDQKRKAESIIERLEESNYYEDSIVTELEEFATFYPAEPYHQDYYEKNPNQAYCRQLIPPKLEKIKQHHADKISQ